MRRATLTGADLSGADLSRAVTTDVVTGKRTKMPEGWDPSAAAPPVLPPRRSSGPPPGGSSGRIGRPRRGARRICNFGADGAEGAENPSA
ncbi:pentapeptide repeat-containing protein [Streptomyces sp. NPDC054865]